MADFYTKYYIEVITILWATTFSLCVLFLPKVLAFFRERRKGKRRVLTALRKYVPGSSGDPQQQSSTSMGELISLDRMLSGGSMHLAVGPQNATQNSLIEVHEVSMDLWGALKNRVSLSYEGLLFYF